MPVTITKSATTEAVRLATRLKASSTTTASPKIKRGSGSAKPRKPLISLNEPGRLYAGHVLAVAGFSASSLFQRIKDGRWPVPHKDGRRNFWHTHEVKAALGL